MSEKNGGNAAAPAAQNLIILCNLKDLKKVSITISSSTKHVTALLLVELAKEKKEKNYSLGNYKSSRWQ